MKADLLKASRERLEYYFEAKEEAQELRAIATKEQGKQGAWISAGLQEHWTEAVKAPIRNLEHLATAELDYSLQCWKLAGKRSHTWRRFLELAKEERSFVPVELIELGYGVKLVCGESSRFFQGDDADSLRQEEEELCKVWRLSTKRPRRKVGPFTSFEQHCSACWGEYF